MDKVQARVIADRSREKLKDQMRDDPSFVPAYVKLLGLPGQDIVYQLAAHQPEITEGIATLALMAISDLVDEIERESEAQS